MRITGKNFTSKLINTKQSKRQVIINFRKTNGKWVIYLSRINKKSITMQIYEGLHPSSQIVLNKILPKCFWKILKRSNKKTLTLPIKVYLDLLEWKDVKLCPSDFICYVEKEAISFMKIAIKNNFKVNFVSKGREYDLQLIGPNGTKFIVAFSNFTPNIKKRIKEMRIRKVLNDIVKMIPFLYFNKNISPIIISKPLKFKNSWSFTTDKYLDFYKKYFNFKFIETDFKKGWENEICKKLYKIDKNLITQTLNINS